MRQTTAFEANTSLDPLLDLVEQGQDVTITRHGRQVARLVAMETTPRQEEARAALRRIRDRAEQLRSGRFDWEEWKALRDEGSP